MPEALPQEQEPTPAPAELVPAPAPAPNPAEEPSPSPPPPEEEEELAPPAPAPEQPAPPVPAPAPAPAAPDAAEESPPDCGAWSACTAACEPAANRTLIGDNRDGCAGPAADCAGGEGECPPTLLDVVVREARGFLMDKKNLPVVIGGAVGAFIVIWLLCVACMHCRGGSGSAKASEPAVAAPVDRDSTTFAGSTERTQFISAGGAGPSDADEEHGRQPEA